MSAPDSRTPARARRAVVILTFAMTSLGGVIASYSAETGAADASDSARTLAHAIETALAHSPLLASAPHERAASEARRDQAGQRPPWELSTTAENILGRNETAGVRAAEATVELGRTLERGGKRAARLNVADRETAVLAEDLASRERELIAEVTRRFADALEHQALAEIRARQVQLIEGLAPVAEHRVASGRASRAEQASLRAALARAQLAFEQEQAARTLAQQGLAAVIGQPEWSIGALQGDLAEAIPLPQESALFGAIESAAPVRVAQREAELAQARVQVAHATAVADVHVAAGTRRLQELHTEAFVLSWSLPLGTRRYSRPIIREANAELEAAKARVDAARTQVGAVLTDAWGEVQSSHRAIGTLSREVLPAALDAADVLEHGYRLGRFSLLEVTTARQTATDAQIELITEEARYRRALAELERVLGGAAVRAGRSSSPTTP